MRPERSSRSLSWIAVAVFGLIAVAATLAALWLLPAWVADWDGVAKTGSVRVASQNATRQSILWIAGGTIAIITLVFTWRRDQVARVRADLDRDANFTTRYTEAITQLGSENVAIRLGGVYALERIAIDSERDRQTITDVLAAVLRLPPLGSDSPEPPGWGEKNDRAGAIAVLVRLRHLSPGLRLDLNGAQLFRAKLDGANLTDAIFTGANLEQADLRAAIVIRTRFFGTRLVNADLQEARGEALMIEADLSSANLNKADLSDADLLYSTLKDAKLREARLDRVNLHGVNATNADFSSASLRSAVMSRAIFTNARFTDADRSDALESDVDLGASFDWRRLDAARRPSREPKAPGSNYFLDWVQTRRSTPGATPPQ